MPTSLKIIITTCFVLLFLGCSKNESPLKPEEQSVRYLTSETGNRVWRISKRYENGVEVPLTANQLKYTKTYTRTGTQQQYGGSFTDSDGYTGRWVLSSVVLLIDVITNNTAGDIKVDWIINSLTEQGLDIEHTENGKTTRLIFYAL